jgi:hypothetical protein
MYSHSCVYQIPPKYLQKQILKTFLFDLSKNILLPSGISSKAQKFLELRNKTDCKLQDRILDESDFFFMMISFHH